MDEEKVYCSMYSRNAELYHHGIKGQKWGVRNGPPYPLDSDKSAGKRLKKDKEQLNKDISESARIISNKEAYYYKEFTNTDFYKKMRKEQDQLFTKEQKEKIDELELKILDLLDNFDELTHMIEMVNDDSKEAEDIRKEYKRIEEEVTKAENALSNLKGNKYKEIDNKILDAREKYVYDHMKNDKEVLDAEKRGNKARKILYNT